MPNFNQVTLVGNLTRDPELSYTPNQTAVVDFGIAVNRKWKSSDGSAREETCFMDCRAFGARAVACEKYLGKGNLVLVAGYLKFEQWEKEIGSAKVNFSKHRLIAEKVEFLPSGEKSSREPGQEG